MDRGNGGIPACRAVVRWAWRLFRREWRQQILVLALLTVAVAATIVSASAAYNLAPVSGNAESGTANHFLRFDAPAPRALAANVAAAEAWFSIIDVMTHRDVPVPGSVESIDYRAQDPWGAYGAPMIDLREGRYPTGGGEVAVTDGVAETFGLHVGAPFALDGVARTVVGLVENPSDLADEFALLAPSSDDSPESVTILVDASSDEVDSFLTSGGFRADGTEIGSRQRNEDVLAAAAVLGVAMVALVLVSLVAAAGFVVMAQRRLRQLGMLAAIGATEKHLRLVMVANGAVIGAVAAVIGAAAGLVGWVAVVPLMEPAVGHRMERFNVPWWLIGTGMLLAVVSATGAAWWPARAVARTPITQALSGRPPGPKPAHRSAALAGMILVVGVVCLAFRDGPVFHETGVDLTNALLVIVGTVATIVGVLLISPLAIRALATAVGWLPIAVRLALRDLARYSARSGAALAAISLTLGISSAVVIGAAAAEDTADEGNLSGRQLLVWTRNASDPEGVSPFYTVDPNDSGFSPFVPEMAPAEVSNLEAQVDRIAALLDDPTVTALDVALDPAVAPDPGFVGRLAVSLARRFENGYMDVALLYVTTPELLEHYGLDLGAIDPDTDILTVETGELRILGVSRERGTQPEVVSSLERLTPRYSSLPGSFVTPEALRQRGWESVRVGWLVETGTLLTSEQLAAARDLAADAGLLIETRRDQPNLATLRTGATAAGMLVALSVLAMTVGLIRSEAAGDLRTLTAAGATSTIRRTLTAATAGGLAFLGALLGIAGAYLALTAGSFGDISAFSPIPILHLLVIAVGVPLVAAIAGWLLAGREPPALARQPIE